MYLTLSKSDWLKALNLPSNYEVHAFIADGSYLKEERFKMFTKILNNVGYTYQLEPLKDDFLATYVWSLKVSSKAGQTFRLWYGVFYGGAALSELTHIASILGSQLNLLRGDVGGLHKTLKTGDMLIPLYSYGNESSTRLYARDNPQLRFYTDEKLRESTIELLKKHGIFNIYVKPTTTCQAMLAESEEDIKSWQEEGFWGVEMEASTLLAVSNYFKVPALALLLVSDNLVTQNLVTDEEYVESHQEREKLRQNQYEVLVELMLHQLTKPTTYANQD